MADLGSERAGQEKLAEGQLLEAAPELLMSSVLLKVNAKGEVQPEVKVYTDPRDVDGEGMEAAVARASEIAQKTLADLAQAYGWPGTGPKGQARR